MMELLICYTDAGGINRVVRPQHLIGAVGYKTRNGKNTCVQRSTALAFDLPGSELCFGTVRAATDEERKNEPRGSAVPFIHAWVELDGIVYPPTLIEKCGNQVPAFPRDIYYQVNGIRDVYRLDQDALERLDRRLKLRTSFKLQTNRAAKGTTTEAILKAARVPYAVTPEGGLVPAEQGEDA